MFRLLLDQMKEVVVDGLAARFLSDMPVSLILRNENNEK